MLRNLLLLVVLLPCLGNQQVVDAFAVNVVNRPTSLRISRERQPFLVLSGADQDSEWYNPPPIKEPRAPQPEPGQRIMRSDIKSSDELGEFLDADDRPTVVNFYANWYVFQGQDGCA